MKAVILAGGFGTRLKHILPDVPKPMADINGEPFLEMLIKHLEKQGFTEFTIATHHMRDVIEGHFRDCHNIKFAPEAEPLGTGGAILNSIKKLHGDVVVFNGDTYLELNYEEFFKRHRGTLTIALREVDDTARYGRVNVDGKRITSFTEKGAGGIGLINGGCYIINCEWMKCEAIRHNLPKKFSFETDFMMKLHPEYYITHGYFIDIGIPEDYARAQRELNK